MAKQPCFWRDRRRDGWSANDGLRNSNTPPGRLVAPLASAPEALPARDRFALLTPVRIPVRHPWGFSLLVLSPAVKWVAAEVRSLILAMPASRVRHALGIRPLRCCAPGSWSHEQPAHRE